MTFSSDQVTVQPGSSATVNVSVALDRRRPRVSSTAASSSSLRRTAATLSRCRSPATWATTRPAGVESRRRDRLPVALERERSRHVVHLTSPLRVVFTLTGTASTFFLFHPEHPGPSVHRAGRDADGSFVHPVFKSTREEVVPAAQTARQCVLHARVDGAVWLRTTERQAEDGAERYVHAQDERAEAARNPAQVADWETFTSRRSRSTPVTRAAYRLHGGPALPALRRLRSSGSEPRRERAVADVRGGLAAAAGRDSSGRLPR